MTSILKSVENSPLIEVPQNTFYPPKHFITKSICYHAANMANATAICTLTNVDIRHSKSQHGVLKPIFWSLRRIKSSSHNSTCSGGLKPFTTINLRVPIKPWNRSMPSHKKMAGPKQETCSSTWQPCQLKRKAWSTP